MRPDRIILVRHGQSEGNVDKRMYAIKPDWKLELTETGHKQAHEAGLSLKKIIQPHEAVQFYCSTFIRTRQTFDGVFKAFGDHQTIVREDPRLREQEWGHYRDVENSLKIEEERDQFGVFYYRFPDGESCADVYDRLSGFLDTMYRDFQKEDFPKNVVIVTHGMLIRVFLMRLFHWSPEKFHTLGNPHNGEHIVLEREKDGKHFQLVTPLREYEPKGP